MTQISVFLLAILALQICFVQASTGSPRKLQTDREVSWEEYWTQKLPSTPPPREMTSLAPSLNVLEAKSLAKRLQVDQSNPGAYDSPFCRNYGFLCGGDVHGPLVCIGPYWYMYTDRAKCEKDSKSHSTDKPHDGPTLAPDHEAKNVTSLHEAKNNTVFHEVNNNTIFHQDKNVTIFHDSKNNTIYQDQHKNVTTFYESRNDTLVRESRNDTRHETSNLFFRPTYLTEGRKILFPKLDNNLQGRSFLPAQLAEIMPLDTNRLKRYMKVLEVPERSNMATSMEYTLAFCNSSSKEVRSCHESIESMVDFVVQEMGSHVVSMLPSYTPSHTLQVQLMATPLALSSANGTSITCHDLMFPYLIYGCHVIPHSIIYDVVLQPTKDTPSFHAPYVCHLDTRSWDPSHMAFAELDAHPGDGPICHWVPQNNIIWFSA